MSTGGSVFQHICSAYLVLIFWGKKVKQKQPNLWNENPSCSPHFFLSPTSASVPLPPHHRWRPPSPARPRRRPSPPAPSRSAAPPSSAATWPRRSLPPAAGPPSPSSTPPRPRRPRRPARLLPTSSTTTTSTSRRTPSASSPRSPAPRLSSMWTPPQRPPPGATGPSSPSTASPSRARGGSSRPAAPPAWRGWCTPARPTWSLPLPAMWSMLTRTPRPTLTRFGYSVICSALGSLGLKVTLGWRAASVLAVGAVRECGERAEGAGGDDGTGCGRGGRDEDVRAAAEQSLRSGRFQLGEVCCWICKVSLGQGIPIWNWLYSCDFAIIKHDLEIFPMLLQTMKH